MYLSVYTTVKNKKAKWWEKVLGVNLYRQKYMGKVKVIKEKKKGEKNEKKRSRRTKKTN